jgi:protein-S-isoprenylcysteine O-methyltransferase Ste14
VLTRLAVLGAGLVFALSLLGFALHLAPGGRLSRDAGSWTAAGWTPIAIDLALFTLFALHHSIFARLGVKRWLTARVPPHLERTTYVWISSVLFTITYLAWQPVPGRLWHATGALGVVLTALPIVGVVMTLHAARRLDVLDLSGVRQGLRQATVPAVRGAVDSPLIRTGLYGLVRHPIYLGWVWLVWPTADMTGTRLAFAAISTVYLAIAIPFEERGLRETFGRAYDDYRREVRWRMLPFIY